MSTFYAVRNLTEQTIAPCEPWSFKPETEIPAQVRGCKQDRQQWYRTKSTEHNFYTAVEPANPNIRPSKENPPRLLHGIVADYDIAIPEARIDEAIDAMKIKPAWVERSLGGNARLVWVFPRPLLVEDTIFACAVLEAVESWLGLSLLPGLDGPALRDPNRLYCNGGTWRETGFGPVEETALQAFFVNTGRKHRFKGAESGSIIPLDVVEKELQAKYPGFVWPGEFALESQGPSFWLAASTSPLSAVVKPEGFFTFSASAEKPFYGWADILGAEFVKQFAEQTITKATADIFWDSKRFWRRKNGYFASLDMTELQNYFKVDCRLSAKPGKDGQSTVDHALNHIYNAGHIAGAAPFLFRPSGALEFLGKRVLNTYVSKVLKPAEAEGEFPFLQSHFEALFDPPEQRFHFFAWLKHYYTSAVTLTPMPGQNIYLMGGANVGKCIGRGVRVMLHDGTSKASEDITTGDILMGDDGTPRTVLQANSGFGPMYRVTPNRGDSWTCNDEHILVLRGIDNVEKKWSQQDEIEITVKDYLKSVGPSERKKRWRLFSTDGWDRPTKVLEHDPYIYGLWLGDGGRHHGELTTESDELANIWTQYFIRRGLLIKKYLQPDNASNIYIVSAYENGGSRKINPWRSFVKSSSFDESKFILPDYLDGDRKQRIQLLAGLLDTDGHLCNGASTFEITQKSKILAHQIAFLARSLGFCVSLKETVKSCQTEAAGLYYRLFISGATGAIPTKLERKRAKSSAVRRKFPFKIESIGDDEFFGILISGNGRFLLSDGTVTHNTLTSRGIIGAALGGFVDAADFLVHGAQFNSELFEAPLWCVDDETPGESAAKQANFFALLKKITANQQFKHNKKFEVATMVEWMGRILCTTNLDYVSSRMLGPMDNTSMDKTCLFRCRRDASFTFPKRHELTQIILAELPFFLRWLLAWEPPDCVIRDVRYGYRAFHEPSLLEQSHQSSRVAPFKELLIETLSEYFAGNPAELVWRGTVSQIIRLLHSNPLNDHVLRSLRLEQITRYLEQIQREDLFRCTVERGELNTRVWCFARFTAQPVIAAIPAAPVINIFSK